MREDGSRSDSGVEAPAEDGLQLWSRFHAGDASAREQLALQHLPHARRVAATYYRRRLHDEIEFDDYMQLAVLGMMESLDRFDPSLGISFKTFSGRRMHGAILDGLEKMTEKQQQIAARQRAQKDRLASLVQSSGDQRVDVQTAQLFRYLAEVGVGLALSFMLDGTGMIDPGDTASAAGSRGGLDGTPYRRRELHLLREKLLAHVDGLKPQARQVVRCHYIQEMPFDAIAVSMGLTKGRVSQIHREALLWLRSELKVDRSSDLVC